MSERSSSVLTIIVIYAILMLLTVLTAGLGFLHLGAAGHLAVGLGIAAIQGLLIAMFYMHLVKSSARAWLAAAVGLYWLGIELTLTLNDYITRSAASF